MDFYTYAYLREDGSPYYVGKGRNQRIFKNTRSTPKPTCISRIVFLRENMTEEQAIRHEIEMIKLWGRKDLGTGMLRNKTDGGEGVPAIKWSEDRKKKWSLVKTSFKHTKETKKKMSLSAIGRTGWNHTEETKAKIKANHRCKIKGYIHHDCTKKS